MFTSPPLRRNLLTCALRSRQLNSLPRSFQTSPIDRKDEAFNPKTTRPEEQKESAGEDLKELTRDDTSPVDETANMTRDPQEGGAQGSKAEEGQGPKERQGPSGGGSPKKAGGGSSGGGGGSS